MTIELDSLAEALTQHLTEEQRAFDQGEIELPLEIKRRPPAATPQEEVVAVPDFPVQAGLRGPALADWDLNIRQRS